MKKLFFTLFLSTLMLGAMAQKANDPVIFEIGGKPIYKSQFMKEFLQSIGKDPAAAPTACTYEKRKALEDYVQLYVNFQTKLADAYALGLDTTKALTQELATYRKELAAPYLIDSATTQALLREAYDRNHYVLHAAHILVPCRENSLPEDTLKALNHANELYQQALKATDFYTVAQQEMHDQRINDRDPLMREKADEKNPMEGDLGCFSVFDMIYSFESAAYQLKPGEISKPVRSRYGYHIIKLFDRYNHYGKVQLAHIWISENEPSAKGKINSAYRQLQEGVDFGIVAKNYSNDRSTSTNGGIMPELPHNQLPPAYIGAVASGLKVGEYSEPFHSRFGWHIVKLLKKETMPSYESMVPYYKSRMTRGERSSRPQHIFAEQCKQTYNFVDYTTTKASKKKNAPYMASLSAVRNVVTDSIFSAIFNYDSNAITDMRPLFKIGDKEYNSRQFAKHIYKNKKVRPLCNLDMFVQERYREFVEDMVINYADSRLELDNEEFAGIIDEYRHGLMIFSYNDHMVWSRALKDTAGFEAFYESASQKHDYNDTNDAPYFWNERARVHIYDITDTNHNAATLKAADKVMAKAAKKAWSSSQIVAELTARCKKATAVSDSLALVESGSGNTLLMQGMTEMSGNNTFWHNTESGYRVLVIEKMLPPELKTRDEARGFYLNDYQNYLEEQNNANLRIKYNVKIHQDVIDEIVY